MAVPSGAIEHAILKDSKLPGDPVRDRIEGIDGCEDIFIMPGIRH